MPIHKDDIVLWRYMSLGSLLSVLQRKALHFTSLQKLSETDRYEGPVFNEEKLSFAHLSKSLELYQQGKRREADELTRNHDLFSKTFVNCWHDSHDESFAMWRIYGREEGVAIRTTMPRLREAFHSPDVKVDPVDYGDFRIDLLPRFLWKRPCFSYEKEVRAYVMVERLTDFRGFRKEQVDLPTLIDAIVISPVSPWLRDVVADELAVWKLDAEVTVSGV
jgi:hypothetical protein